MKSWTAEWLSKTYPLHNLSVMYNLELCSALFEHQQLKNSNRWGRWEKQYQWGWDYDWEHSNLWELTFSNCYTINPYHLRWSHHSWHPPRRQRIQAFLFFSKADKFIPAVCAQTLAFIQLPIDRAKGASANARAGSGDPQSGQALPIRTPFAFTGR